MSDITLVVSAPGPTVDLTADAPGAVTVTVESGGGVSTHAGLPDLATSGHPASAIAFTPTGSIAATTVQAAVAEVATDAAAAYQPLDADLTAIAALTTPATTISGAAQKASNLSDLASASSARTNLGLGGAAILAVGTTAGTVAAGDDSRITGAVPKSTVTTAGDLIYGTGNAAVSRLGIGSALQVLRTNAGATAPEWATVSSGAVSVIARTVLGSDTASVDFTSIPSTYENLMVTYVARGTGSSFWSRLWVRFNGDTAANYESSIYYQSAGAENVTAATKIPVGMIPDAAATAGFAASGQIDIAGYARTVFNKSAITVGGAQYAVGTGAQLASFGQGLWVSTAAINQVTLLPSSGNFKTGSVFTLYGIAGA